MDVGVAPACFAGYFIRDDGLEGNHILLLFFLPVNADTGDNGPLIQFSRIPAACYRAQAAAQENANQPSVSEHFPATPNVNYDWTQWPEQPSSGPRITVIPSGIPIV